MTGSWRDMADRKLRTVRAMVNEELCDDPAWPIWIHGTEIGFPSDDAVMPTSPPANDRLFTFSR